mgnify:CR=1 FL=1
MTPSITPDGKIQMKLDISKDSVAGAAPNGELILNKNNYQALLRLIISVELII